MKQMSVLIVVAILGLVLWALPAGAEKIRLTDAEIDGIAGGISVVSLVAPPVGSPVFNCCAQVGLNAFGELMPLNGGVALGVLTTPINPTISSNVGLSASGALPGALTASGGVTGPKGLFVIMGPFVIPIP
jgi:hypothetical protein